jgi:imidazolonepropionase-like amidohydrolase
MGREHTLPGADIGMPMGEPANGVRLASSTVTLRIDADLLIPGRGEPVEGGSVVLDGPVITYAGPTASAPSVDEAGVEVPLVMPGLWEAHAHFTGIQSPDLADVVRLPLPMLGALAAADIEATLMGGVTSAREVGGFGLDIAPAVDGGLLPGPTIYAAGHVLSTTGGHGDIHSLPIDFVESLDWLAMLCDGVPDCLRAVRLQLRRGARVIKICASGGVMSEIDDPIHQQFSDEELAAIVSEARRADRVVAAHCHGKPGIMAALAAGVHTIEHGTWLDEEAADTMRQAGAVLVPTRFVVETLLQMTDRLPAHVRTKSVAIADRHLESMRIAVAAGVTIAMGTDIFLPGGFGQNSAEIRFLVDAGMSPLQAVEAATANGPLTLGPQAPRSGLLEAGYDADVIALDADPLADLDVWGNPDRVTHVWKAGVRVK